MLGSVGFGSIYEAGPRWVTPDRVKLRYNGPVYLILFWPAKIYTNHILSNNNGVCVNVTSRICVAPLSTLSVF